MPGEGQLLQLFDPGQRFIVELVWLGRGHYQPHARLPTTDGQTPSHVVGVADPGKRVSFQLADQLADRVQIGQRLARVAEVGQTVDHGTGAMFGNLDDRLMAIGADHDHVGILAEDAGEIGDALTAAEANLIAKEDRASAEVGHARLEAHTGPHGRLLEQ